FRAADIPKRLVPGAIALGAFTFTMTALPGTVQIQNMIPMRYFGTTAFAAPVTGTIAAAMMLGAGLWWLQRRANRARQRGEGYGEGHTCEPAAAIERLPPLWAALAPIACVLIANYVLSEHVIPRWDPAPLSRPPLGPVSLSDVRGVWATIIALILAIGVAAPLYLRTARSFNGSLTQGALGSLLPVFNTASEVGYGKTIAALAGFALVKSSLLSVPGSVLASEAVAVNALAGITGSASGGLGIALEALGPTYLQRALEAGISPDLLHRIASLSCGGLDTLPHNGAVITLLAICGLSHRQSYVDVAVVTVIVPVAATALIVAALSVAL
ncbi:MAG: GntP family permease, partial [Planctomycetes bacterium]|nr:GntP family permease [Planctomycetota bacterium]